MANFDWRDLSVLLAVARARSLGTAAKRLGLSAPTVGRRIAGLERVLEVKLFERTATGAHPTPAGARIVALAEHAEDRIAAIERAAVSLRESGGPAVRVSAVESIISERLAPAVSLLFARHPAIRIELRSSPTFVSLARGEADMAVRMVRPIGQSLVARRLPPIPFGLYASRSYLGTRQPEQLRLHQERLLGYDDSYGPIPELSWLSDIGLSQSVGLRCSSTRGLLLATASGAGIAILPSRLAAAEGLIEIPAPQPLPIRAPWLVMHRESRALPGVRKVAAWVVEAFARKLDRH
jgi:DNA-binding transcriptional LysR family regulator